MAATLGAAFPEDNLKSVVGGCAGAAAARSRVSPSEVSYLTFRAFHAVLGRKSQGANSIEHFSTFVSA